MFNSLVDFVFASSWTLPLIFAIAALDAFFPVVPSEATVITAGVFAATGELSLPLVVLAGALGAVVGDNVSYWAGRKLGRPVTKRLFRGRKARERLEWAEGKLDERGGYLVVVSRFVPGGRTAVTFSAGLVKFSWLRFLGFDVLAGILWASYAAALGYFGGRTFEDEPWKGLLVAFALAGTLTLAVEGYRRFVRGASA